MLFKERINSMGMIISNYYFQKTYFLIDNDKLVELFLVYEDRNMVYRDESKKNKSDIITLKSNMRERYLDEFEPSFIEELEKGDIVKDYHLTKEKRDNLLQYESLFDVSPFDYNQTFK